MFYDLNVPWSANDPDLARNILFLHELGYDTLVLNHTLPTPTSASKPSTNFTCPIILPLPSLPRPPASLKLLTRLTIPLSTPSSNPRITACIPHYSLVALRPLTQIAFQFACTTPIPITLISLDLSVRHPYHFKGSLCRAAIKRGVRFEICYSEGISGARGPETRRCLIAGARELVRACGGAGRGIVLCSGGSMTRAPADVMNLGVVWGMGPERARDGVGQEAAGCIRAGGIRRDDGKGVIEVVYGGERVAMEKTTTEVIHEPNVAASTSKRKADQMEQAAGQEGGETDGEVLAVGGAEKKIENVSISKRKARKDAKRARLESREAGENQQAPEG